MLELWDYLYMGLLRDIPGQYRLGLWDSGTYIQSVWDCRGISWDSIILGLFQDTTKSSCDIGLLSHLGKVHGITGHV